jgi:hypothetical protein
MKGSQRNASCPCGSGKKLKRCCGGLVQVRPVDLEADPLSRAMLLGEGMEPLTDALVEELVERGWERAKLVELRGDGAQYHRGRNSVFLSGEVGDEWSS